MKLLVTRPALDAGPLAELLTAAGHTVLLDPLLTIRVRDRTVLDLDGITGLLFTSGNGVRAFATLSERRDIPVYAVGDRTATLAREQGFQQVESADGDVAALAELVGRRRRPSDGPLLHVSGHDTVGELAQRLETAGYAVRRAVLYDAEPAADLAPATRAALGTGTLDGVLLFSPRTARHFAALMHLSGLSARAQGLAVWCLSPAVAEALGGLQFARIHVAAQPTQAALLSLVVPPVAQPPAAVEVPRPKEDVLTEAPPPKTPPANGMPPEKKPAAAKKGRVEPTIAAALPPDPSPDNGPTSAPDAAFVAPFPFEMPDADPVGAAPPPASDAAKARSRRSPLVIAGIVALALVGSVAVFEPMIKDKLEESGLGGGSPAQPTSEAPTPGEPTLHADGGVTETAPPQESTGPHVMMPAHEPAAGSTPPPETTAAAPAPASPAPDSSTPALQETGAPVASTDAAASGSSAPAPAQDAGSSTSGSFAARLDTAEARLDRLQATTAPVGAVSGLQQGVAALTQRLAALETRPTADPASVQAVAADLRRVSATLNDATNRLARLEQQVQQQADAQRDQKATVLALAELKDRLAGSGPFDGPVAVLKSAAGDDPAAAPSLATLDRFAVHGVASRAKLAEELDGLPAAVNQPLPPAADAGLWQRIQARAEKLVTVRRIDDGGGVEKLPPGPDRSLAVASAALKAGDLAGAVQAVQGLDGHAAEIAKPWLTEASDRLAVEDAVNRLGTLATQRLQGTGMPAPAPTAPTPDQGAAQ